MKEVVRKKGEDKVQEKQAMYNITTKGGDLIEKLKGLQAEMTELLKVKG